ncbi:hypothetical protein V8G54_027312 [Vigna mungo]|uniref:LysM domain receptor-like kinase 3 n=1 Tax=Vigna mungo TaxID=3915 RepID=A0AAQ3N277_VIGMU
MSTSLQCNSEAANNTFVSAAASQRLVRSYPTPTNCTDTSRVCTSFLAFKPKPSQTLAVIQSMFDVLPGEITYEDNGWDYLFIRKNCSCDAGMKKFVSNTTLTVKSNGGFVHDLVKEAYDGLALLPNTTYGARKDHGVISLNLFCSCSSGLWNYLMSYVIKNGDSVESLASRFGVSMDSIETANNGIDNPGSFSHQQSSSALQSSTSSSVQWLGFGFRECFPGELYHLKNDTPPVPVPSPSVDGFSADQINQKGRMPHEWIVGGFAVGLALIILSVVVFLFLRSPNCLVEARNNATNSAGKISNKFYVFGNPNWFCGCGKPVDQKQTDVFSYEEIFASTDSFSDSNLLGHRAHGSVYYGLLRDQEVAIKRITATKTRELMSEIKVLCKVHHANLNNLLAAIQELESNFLLILSSHDDFFLIYEYAQKGSLSSHLHDTQNKGHSSLSWITRVQIALDAARAIEYIHEHTKTRYVHQGIKTSNILLDASFRAKISDFGLAKLVGKTNEGETTASKGVNAYGYLAPDDVYAFGVVLFEIISGKEAIIQTQGPEKRPLASIMLAILRNSPDSDSMSSTRNLVDPTMMDLYPHDCVHKMAMLAKQCVEDDPVLRPDMKQVVISLSQILLSSAEWEATLAGNSQVFSALVQGR